MRRRIVYGVLLCAALAYYIFHSGYAAWLFLCFVAAFAPLQLLFSLPFWFKTRLQLRAGQAIAFCGQPYALQLCRVNAFALCPVKGRLECKNLFTGKAEHHPFVLYPSEENTEVSLCQEICGVVEVCCLKPRMLDLAGLFALPLPAPAPLHLLVQPAPAEVPLAVFQSAMGAPGRPLFTQASAGAPREFSDIRDFRDGDSLREVHWKLSAKRNRLLVKEFAFGGTGPLYIGFDFWGTPENACFSLAAACSLSRLLLAGEQPHALCWAEAGGASRHRPIATEADLTKLLWQLLAAPPPAARQPGPEAPGRLVMARPGGPAPAFLQGGEL